jgi:HD superfamily phosphodiesterase
MQDMEVNEKKTAVWQLHELSDRMVTYNVGDPKRIQHLIKVHYFARMIGLSEGLDAATQLILEATAIVHDIGIRISEKKYGVCDGKHQEQEGPAEARKLLTEMGTFSEAQIERICWLVGHHHTYDCIEGMDYQILVEADFLVNIYEDNLPVEAVRKVREKIFKTRAGLSLLDRMYL